MVAQCLNCRQNSTLKKVADVLDLNFQKTYSVVQCPSCGVQKTAEFPNNLKGIYETNLFHCEESRLTRFLKKILIQTEIKRLLKITGSKQFLDVGCGRGDFAESLHKFNLSVVATDANPKRPRYIEPYPEIPYIHFDYDTLHIEHPHLIKNRTVILRHVLEHIREPRKFLQRFVECGATSFYIIVPNASSFERKLFGPYDLLWGLPFHLWHFDETSLTNLFKSLGLEIMKTGHETIPTFMENFH